MRNAQLMETSRILPPRMEIFAPYELTLVDMDGEDSITLQIKKVGNGMQEHPQSVIAELHRYFDEIEQDVKTSPNTLCHKGCCDCCSNDFEISITEYFMILRFMDIRYGKDYVQRVAQKAKISFSLNRCIFINCTDGSCDIYEVRSLICGKYGLYSEFGGCDKLDPDKDLLPRRTRYLKKYISFSASEFSAKHFMCHSKRIVHWFGDVRDGAPLGEKMRELFYKSFNASADEFTKTLV